MSSNKKTLKRSFAKEKEEDNLDFGDLKLEEDDDEENDDDSDETELNSELDEDEEGEDQSDDDEEEDEDEDGEDWYDFGSENDQSDSNVSDEDDSLEETEEKYLDLKKKEQTSKYKPPSTPTVIATKSATKETTKTPTLSSSSQKNEKNNKEKDKSSGSKGKVTEDSAKSKPTTEKGPRATTQATQPTKQKNGKEEKNAKNNEDKIKNKNEKGKQKAIDDYEVPASHKHTKAPTGIAVNPEDDDDSSEDESLVNTIGNVPLWWYDDYDHIGYDKEGNKIIKETRKDLLDQFLDQTDNPNYWRTVYDEINGKTVVLSDEQMQLVKDTLTRRFPAGFDAYPDFLDMPVDDEGNMTMKTPLSFSAPRSRFIPMSWGERKKVRNYLIAMRKGWIKINPPKKPDRFFDIWEKREPRAKGIERIPPPKLKLPEHIESYNPPAEYLPTQKTLDYWKQLDETDRPYNYMPTKYEKMADVPTYKNTQEELFQRCLDLYLAPRLRVMRRHFTDPNELLPDLPAPKDLRPFPTIESMRFIGHKGRIRSLSIHPSGEWLASGGNDRLLRVWEVTTGRLMGEWDLGGKIYCVAWNPNTSLHLIACGVENRLVFVTPSTTHGGNFESYSRTEVLLSSRRVIDDENKTQREKEAQVVWEFPDEHTEFVPPKPEDNPDLTHSEHVYDTRAFEPDDETDETKFNTTTKPKTNPKPVELHKDIRLQIKHEADVKVISWHPKGDYLATLLPDAKTNCLFIHQLSRRISQVIFKRNKGSIQAVTFHPIKPHLFVASKRTIRVYDLLKQRINKRLLPDCKWIASIDVHPKGDNVIVSTFDRKVFWFDLELSTKPYKKLRYHKLAVRKVVYHKTLPLFASCSDDLSIHVFHGMVYNDLLQNAFIVPLKILKGHEEAVSLGVLDIVFHPTLPWLFSAGADSTIRLWT